MPGPGLVDQFADLGVPLLTAEKVLDLTADLGERRGTGGPVLVQLDDVKPELGLDDVAQVAGFQGEGCVLEPWIGVASRQEPEVAAAFGGARIL